MSSNNNKVQSPRHVSDDSSDDDITLRRKTKKAANAGSTTTMTSREDEGNYSYTRRQSKTPFVAVCIVAFFVITAVLKGKSSHNDSKSSNAGAIRTTGLPGEHHYTNPYTPSSSGDEDENALNRAKQHYINQKSSTAHAKLHGGWNDLDQEVDGNWTCAGDYPDEDAWQTWLQHVARMGPQAACIRKLRRPCHCRQPLDPIPRSSDIWKTALQRNQELVQTEESQIALSKDPSDQLDVLLLGDSIMEYWQGTQMGLTLPSLKETHQLYVELFRSHKKNINNLHGLALGISGDRCPQLLYRLQHGELKDGNNENGLNPKVVWIFIGNNDYLSNACNAHVIAACNIKVVEYVQKVRPDATVVINSMLPGQSHAAWQELSQINQQLECYAERHENVEFFNAYEYFLTNPNDDASKQVVNKTLLMNDAVHPSTLGYQVWGHAIVTKVKEILAASGDGNSP